MAEAPFTAYSERSQGDPGEKVEASPSPASPQDLDAGLENGDGRAKEVAGLPPNEPKPPTNRTRRPTDNTNEPPGATLSSTALSRDCLVEATENGCHRGKTDSVCDKSLGRGRRAAERHEHLVVRNPSEFAGEDDGRNSEWCERLMSNSGASGAGDATCRRAGAGYGDTDEIGPVGPAEASRETGSDLTCGGSCASADGVSSGEGTVTRETLVGVGNRAQPEDLARDLDSVRKNSDPLVPPGDGVGRNVQDEGENQPGRGGSSERGDLGERDAKAISRPEATHVGATSGNGRQDNRGHAVEGKEEDSADAMSFVKDDDVSGSEDEFGKGVAMHIGDQKRRQNQEQGHQRRYGPSQPEQEGRQARDVSGGEQDGEQKDRPSESHFGQSAVHLWCRTALEMCISVRHIYQR